MIKNWYCCRCTTNTSVMCCPGAYCFMKANEMFHQVFCHCELPMIMCKFSHDCGMKLLMKLTHFWRPLRELMLDRNRGQNFLINVSKMSTSSTGSTKHFTTNDGVKLAYELTGSSGPVLVLIHGWSGSRKYLQRNVPSLAQHCQVYAVDLRHHGDSSSAPPRGFHISRLAADLRDLLEALDLNDVTVVGTSMGCAVIWSYVELFGTKRIAKAVFVDQAPLQNRAPDWNLGSKGCYDEASLRKLQQQLAEDLSVIADGNAAGCLSLPVPANILEELKQETLRCDGRALGAIMADHTQLDWRPVLPLMTFPCLNMVGQCSGVFPLDGCLSIKKLAPNCRSVVFKRANHWLYLEQPDAFNQVLLDFIMHGNDDREPISYVEG